MVPRIRLCPPFTLGAMVRLTELGHLMLAPYRVRQQWLDPIDAQRGRFLCRLARRAHHAPAPRHLLVMWHGLVWWLVPIIARSSRCCVSHRGGNKVMTRRVLILLCLVGSLVGLSVRDSRAAPSAAVVQLTLTDTATYPGQALTVVVMVSGTGPVTATIALDRALLVTTPPSACSFTGAAFICRSSTSPAVFDLSLQVDPSTPQGTALRASADAVDSTGSAASTRDTTFVNQPVPATAVPTGTTVATATATATAPVPTPTATLLGEVPPSSVPTPTSLPEATTNPQPLPDAYEVNDTLGSAAAIDVGGSIDKLSFWPLGDVDYYTLVIKESQRGLTLTVETNVTFGLDTNLRLLLPDGTLIAENDDVSPSDVRSRVAATVLPGRYSIEVTNRSPTRPDFKTYRLTMTLGGLIIGPVQPTATPSAIQIQGDAWENNYDFTHASRIALGETIGPLTFVCPDGTTLVCGDNDFFAFTVKAGYCYEAQTLELSPGIDTNIIVYGPQGDLEAPWTGNDDSDGTSFASRVRFCTSPQSGTIDAFLVIGNVGNVPPPAPITERTYHLLVSLFVPPTPVPTPIPTVTPTALPTPIPTAVQVQGTALPAPIVAATVADAREVVRESAPTGRARVKVAESQLFAAAPPMGNDALAIYEEGDGITLLGSTYLGWVKVLPDGSVTPGWMWAPDLAADRLDSTPVSDSATPGAASPITGTPALSPTPGASGSATVTPPVGGIAALPPIRIAPVPATPPVRSVAPAPQAQSFSVQMCRVSTTKPTTCRTPLDDVRIDVLESATLRQLASSRTDAKGSVSFTVSIPSASALALMIPALGLTIESPTFNANRVLLLYVPQGAQ